jgi:putative transcriptional regulator
MTRCLALCFLLGTLGLCSSVLAADDASLAGELLVAAPELADPDFSQTVVLVVEHDESGAMGLIINRTGETIDLGVLLDSLGVAGSSEARGRPLVVHAGGPVGRDYGFVVHEQGYADRSTADLGHGIAMSVGVGVLQAIAAGDGPQHYLFAVGFAGWGPGQLEAELRAGIWHVAPLARRVIVGQFDGTDPDEETWQRALASRYLHL